MTHVTWIFFNGQTTEYLTFKKDEYAAFWGLLIVILCWRCAVLVMDFSRECNEKNPNEDTAVLSYGHFAALGLKMYLFVSVSTITTDIMRPALSINHV